MKNKDMKNLITVFTMAMMVVLSSCNNNVETKTTTLFVDGSGVEVLIIDSCEYIKIKGGNASWGSHKGNCKFCLTRNKK